MIILLWGGGGGCTTESFTPYTSINCVTKLARKKITFVVWRFSPPRHPSGKRSLIRATGTHTIRSDHFATPTELMIWRTPAKVDHSLSLFVPSLEELGQPRARKDKSSLLTAKRGSFLALIYPLAIMIEEFSAPDARHHNKLKACKVAVELPQTHRESDNIDLLTSTCQCPRQLLRVVAGPPRGRLHMSTNRIKPPKTLYLFEPSWPVTLAQAVAPVVRLQGTVKASHATHVKACTE